MISQAEENYLKAILGLTYEKDEVNIKELSLQLDVKMPSANSMVKRLAEKGMVLYESYKPLKLTQEGKKRAALIVRKHRLTEMYLFKAMGFGWEEVHEIAEQIEHIKSTKFFDKMDKLLGYPKVDPHGSPIPDKNGYFTFENYKKLSSCVINDQVTISGIADSSEELLLYLNKRNISLGMTGKIMSVESIDQTITLRIENKLHILSVVVCEKLLVTASQQKEATNK